MATCQFLKRLKARQKVSDIPQEDIALTAETLSDDEVIIALIGAVQKAEMNFPQELKDRMESIKNKKIETLPLRRKLERNKEAAMELIGDYPIYASTSGIGYEEAIEIAVALNFDPNEVE